MRASIALEFSQRPEHHRETEVIVTIFELPVNVFQDLSSNLCVVERQSLKNLSPGSLLSQVQVTVASVVFHNTLGVPDDVAIGTITLAGLA